MIKNTTIVACLGVISLLASFVYAQGGYGPMGGSQGVAQQWNQYGLYYDNSAGYKPRTLGTREESAVKRLKPESALAQPEVKQNQDLALAGDTVSLVRKKSLH